MKVLKTSKTGVILNEKQDGMTFIGIVLMLLLFGVFALVGLKLLPIYYENLGVTKSLESFEEEYKLNTTMPISKMRASIQRRFDTNDVSSIKGKDIVIKKAKGGYIFDASYSPKVNYMGNLNLVVDFEHKLELKK